MMVRVLRLDGDDLWLTCSHVLFHGDPDMEPAKDDPNGKKGWMELIGMPSRLDNSFMYEGLASVLVYEYGRMIHNKVINQ